MCLPLTPDQSTAAPCGRSWGCLAAAELDPLVCWTCLGVSATCFKTRALDAAINLNTEVGQPYQMSWPCFMHIQVYTSKSRSEAPTQMYGTRKQLNCSGCETPLQESIYR